MRSTAPSPRRVYDLSWHGHDLVPLVVLCAAGVALLAPEALRSRPSFDPAGPIDAQRVALATEKLDPNTANAASLQRLRNIGAAKSRAIVAYGREHGPRPFPSAEDLARVRGIGPGTVETVRPYLKFPSPP